MDSSKQDANREIIELKAENEQMKKDIIDRCSLNEMITLKQQLLQQVDTKVDLKEVQTALNDCQNDLADQLTQFKQKTNEKIQSQEITLTRVIERKVDHKDYKQIVDDKMDKSERGQFAKHDDIMVIRMQNDDILR